jgi:hypothetical protein
MHLAMHAAQHGPKFEKHRNELSLALARWTADVWASAATLAEDVGGLEFFAAGLRLVPLGAQAAAALDLPPTAELEWAIENRDGRPRGTFHFQAFRDAETASQRFSILRRSLLPSRDWITYQHPWAERGWVRLAAAYGLHLLRGPLWVGRVWAFDRRAKRAAHAKPRRCDQD